MVYKRARLYVFVHTVRELRLMERDVFLLQKKLGKLPQLSQLGSVPAQLLQISRSAPLLLGAVVGQKSKAHVEENLSMATVQPLSEGDFARAVKALRQ